MRNTDDIESGKIDLFDALEKELPNTLRRKAKKLPKDCNHAATITIRNITVCMDCGKDMKEPA